MAAIVRDWIVENCETVGTGDLILVGSLDSAQARFRDGIPAGKVWYSIYNDGDREAGIGDFNGVDQIVRSDIFATLINGTYVEEPDDPLILDGESLVSCTLNAEAWNAMRAEMDQVIIDLDLLEVAVGEIGDNNEALEVQVATNTLDIATSRTNIGSNTSDISTLTTDLAILDNDVSFRESAVTAMEVGGEVTGNGPTSVLVAAGSGEIIDSYTDTENQNTVDVTWVEQTVDLLATGGMPVVTGIGFTGIGIDSAGLVQSFPGDMSLAQRRKNIYLGFVEYTDQVLSKVVFTPVVSNQMGNILLDLIEYIPSSIKLKGLTVRPTTAADMAIWRDVGQVFRPGINYENALDNQNVVNVPAKGDVDTGIEMFRATYNDGGDVAVTGPFTLVPGDEYELDGAGVVSALPNNTVTIHYILESLGKVSYLSYGQKTYADYATAVNNLFADRSEHQFASAFDAMILLAQIVVTKGATAIDGVVAGIYPLGSSSTSGSGAGSSGNAIDINYTDTYNLGTNVQVALDTLGSLKLSPDQYAAVNAANAPTAANAFATMDDVLDVADSGVGPAVGVASRPIVDLPLLGDLSFLRGSGAVSFSRDSIATYVDRQGNVHFAEIDQPRFEKNGLLIETEMDNLALQSVALDTDLSEWSLGGNAVHDGVVDSPAVGFEPFGSGYAYTSSVSAAGAFIQQSVAVINSRDYVASVWLRSDAPAAILAGNFSVDGVDVPLAGAVTTAWKRFQLTFTSTSSSITFQPFSNMTVGAQIEVWGAQVEGGIGGAATSLIPTEGTAVNRGIETCELNYFNNSPTIPEELSIMADVDVIALDTTQQVAFAVDNARGITASVATGGFEVAYNNGGSHVSAQVLTPNVPLRLGMTTDNVTDKFYVDGAETATAAYGTPPTLTEKIYIGNGFASSSRLDGHVKNFRIYDTELKSLDMGMA